MLLDLVEHSVVKLLESRNMWRRRQLSQRRDCCNGWRKRDLFALLRLLGLERRRRRWRRLRAFELIITLLHVIEEVGGSAVLSLLG